ncbi:hypothetical protein BCR22_08275 [Enterococcus plantarum]|uniref:Uncharacterized protein n=1 Tax=Enterococcus plantarum TaxID=1077675 RepID=A0A2W3Z708_9ENTE|nr:hypothetical protein [Enterococcus plantarum]OEG08507.1 hypothetical protein BCR22_08275 [Enterococcus plantarum]PZL75681.1 hypothetical protein CI088_04365 [Enterococcus plantarum]
MKEQIQLMKLVFDTLNKLSTTQLDDLLAKKAQLKLIYPEEKKVKNEISNNEIDKIVNEISNELEQVDSRDKAESILNNRTINKQMLKLISKKYNISLNGKDSNTVIIEKIIENVVGSKIKFDALLNTDLKKS